MKNIVYGIRQEHRVCAFLQRRRYATGCFHLSRGAADIFADLGGRHLDIQVKGVRSSTQRIMDSGAALDAMKTRLSRSAEVRLVRATNLNGRTPAVALANGDYVWIWLLLGEGRKDLLHDGPMPANPTRCDYHSW